MIIRLLNIIYVCSLNILRYFNFKARLRGIFICNILHTRNFVYKLKYGKKSTVQTRLMFLNLNLGLLIVKFNLITKVNKTRLVLLNGLFTIWSVGQR